MFTFFNYKRGIQLNKYSLKDYNVKDFQVAQRVKSLPAMRETQVQSLGWEDPLEKQMQPTPVFWPGKSHGQRSLVGYSP